MVAENMEIEKVQIEAGRIAIGAKQGTSYKTILKMTNWKSLAARRKCTKFNSLYKIINNPCSLINHYSPDVS